MTKYYEFYYNILDKRIFKKKRINFYKTNWRDNEIIEKGYYFNPKRLKSLNLRAILLYYNKTTSAIVYNKRYIKEFLEQGVRIENK